MPHPLPSRRPLLLAIAAFLASGASGLVYQVAWQRILALHSGVGIYSVAAIVAAFMLGLGLGSHVGGALSLRLGSRRALVAFAAVELSIGALGALSPWLFYDVLYLRGAHLYATLWRTAALHAAVLVPPTFLMGLSLPLLARGLVHDAGTARRTVGVLYGVNVLGAAAGALLAPWVLIRLYGVRGAIFVAAAGNVFAGLAGLLAGRLAPTDVTAPEPFRTPRPLALWVAVYGLSGFTALSLEMVWFRVLDVAVKSTAFTFGTLLALYLFGSAVGCLAMAARRRPVDDPLKTFLLCQSLLVAYAAGAVVLLVRLPASLPPFQWFNEYWATGALRVPPGGAWIPMLRLYAALPLVLFGPSVVLMGASFPVLQQGVQVDARTSGRRVGLLQAVNIAGCLAGSLLVGLAGFRWVGTAGVLRVLTVLAIGFAVVGLVLGRDRRRFAALGLVLAALALALPDSWALWSRLHGTADPATRVVEDETAVTALVPKRDGRRAMAVNGKYHSWLPFGGTHTRLGAAPALVHPAPMDVAIIGLGSGDTAWAAACRTETRSVTVFELAAGQPTLLAGAAEGGAFAPLGAFLSDPRLRVVVADGRKAIQDAPPASLDLIEADALWPQVAHSGYLYSVEFFALCRSRLKPGGVVCTWSPTDRVYKTFTTVFPHVIGLGDHSILIGSSDPLPLDQASWLARLEEPGVSAYLGARAEDARWLLERLKALHRGGRQHREDELNRDLFPRDEFSTP